MGSLSHAKSSIGCRTTDGEQLLANTHIAQPTGATAEGAMRYAVSTLANDSWLVEVASPLSACRFIGEASSSLADECITPIVDIGLTRTGIAAKPISA
jgi:hypothetical protein